MSNAEFEQRSRQSRRTCTCCHERKSRYRYHGAVRADRHHTLCFECFRSAANRLRSRVLAVGRYA
jgi:hypothetical protein